MKDISGSSLETIENSMTKHWLKKNVGTQRFDQIHNYLISKGYLFDKKTGLYFLGTSNRQQDFADMAFSFPLITPPTYNNARMVIKITGPNKGRCATYDSGDEIFSLSKGDKIYSLEQDPFSIFPNNDSSYVKARVSFEDLYEKVFKRAILSDQIDVRDLPAQIKNPIVGEA